VTYRLSGTVDGVPVTVEFTEEDVSDLTLRATEVHVPYPPGAPPVVFNIRWGQPHFEGALRKGLYGDVVLGDPDFDREYLVDAAPADEIAVWLLLRC